MGKPREMQESLTYDLNPEAFDGSVDVPNSESPWQDVGVRREVGSRSRKLDRPVSDALQSGQKTAY